MIQTLKNESTITNADNNVYMKYMSDFIIYLYTMKKLIELVYYYNFYVKTFEVWIWLPNSDTDYYWRTIDKEKEIRKYKLMIISKEYWFIKWLVENDKIDFDNVNEKTKWDEKIQNQFFWFELYEMVLMLLSIQDNPIEFLCEIIKN